MTLKEKIDNALFYIEPEISLVKCEKIANDFAVEFAEWYLNLYNEDIENAFDNNSPKELLEMYKKEKGL